MLILPGNSHVFSRKEVIEAEHDFAERIKKSFGSVWSPKSDGQYVGVAWDCRHPVAVIGGLWRLCESAKHRGAVRAFGKIETREARTLLRFILFYGIDNERQD